MRLSRTLSVPSVGVILLFASLQSCATVTSTEELVRSTIAGEGAPEWVAGSIVQIPGTVTFVGRGGGINVLDERHAFDEALGHARAQLAQYVATEVTAEACLGDASVGARFLSFDRHLQGDGERVDQRIRSRVHEMADNIVGGVAASEQHWEQWEVSNDRPTGFLTYRAEGTHSFRRYKCWVLTRVDQSLIDTYVTASLAALGRKDRQDSDRDIAAMRLHERVHYGRSFRLIAAEDCQHQRATCEFHEYQVQTHVKAAPAACSFCSDSPHSH